MTLIGTSILSFIATAFRILSGLVINKAVAVFIGPSGLAVIGQFQNFIQMTVVLGQGGINSGVTKFVAECRQSYLEVSEYLKTAIFICLICSTLISIVCIIGANKFSVLLFDTNEFAFVFYIYACVIFFSSLNSVFLATFNGLKRIKLFIGVNITQSIIGLVFTSGLIALMGLKGALLALAINQSIVFIVILLILKFKKPLLKIDIGRLTYNGALVRKFSHYSMMAITAAILSPLSYVILRNHIAGILGWDEAGYWQSIVYISNVYLMVITTSLSTYYLPRLSEIIDKEELKREIIQGYKIIMPIVAVSALSIFTAKDIIIRLLFSEEFMPMKELFLFQLCGDVLKMASWLLAYLFLAKAMTKIYIITEVVFTGSFVCLGIILTNSYGLIGITYAYFINVLMYLPVVLFLVRRNIFS